MYKSTRLEIGSVVDMTREATAVPSYAIFDEVRSRIRHKTFNLKQLVSVMLLRLKYKNDDLRFRLSRTERAACELADEVIRLMRVVKVYD